LVGSANTEPGLWEGYDSIGAAAGTDPTTPVGSLTGLPALRDGSWNAAATDGSVLIVAGADSAGAHLLSSAGGRWEKVPVPAAAADTSPVAVTVTGAQVLLAALDREGRPRMWHSPSLRAPSWSERAAPTGVTVGSHPRSIVHSGPGDPLVFSARGRTPDVAAERRN
jgi:hypothetical protein